MRVARLLVCLSLPLIALGCSKVNFAPAEEASQTPTPVIPVDPPDTVIQNPVCRTENVEQSRPVRVLFIVDQSGSNVNGPYEHPGAATDPAKNFRSGIVRSFLDEHASKTNLSWGMITFNGTTAKALVNSGSTSAPLFTNNINAVSSAISTFEATADVGTTPYKAALKMAEAAILADRTKSAELPLYLIAFITDGYPTDYCPNSPTEVECPGRIQDNKIDEDVRALTAAAPDHVQIGTVYYGAADSSASARLRRMASLGAGQFVDLNIETSISLNDVIQVPQTICE